MEKVAVADVESDAYDPANRSHEMRRLSDPLGAVNVSINHYVLEPGERFSGSVHAHTDQEELFLVVAGTATFETRDGEITVDDGEAIRFGPGEFQSGRNDSDGTLAAFGVGAPRESGDVLIDRIPEIGRDIECPECGRESMRATADDDGADLVCPDCGGETTIE